MMWNDEICSYWGKILMWRDEICDYCRKILGTIIYIGAYIFLRPSRHVLSRALVVHSGQILLMRQRYGVNYSLPGGHVETKESIQCAVEREFFEECGLRLKAQKLLGIVEQSYKKCGFLKKQTLTFVWQMDPIATHEDIRGHEFWEKPEWIPLSDIQHLDLQPVILKKWIPEWMENHPMTFHSTVPRHPPATKPDSAVLGNLQ